MGNGAGRGGRRRSERWAVIDLRPSRLAGIVLGSRPWVTSAVVAAGIAGTAVTTYAAGGTRTVFPQLGNVFVVIAAATLGPAAGAVAGLLAGATLGPLMPLDVADATPQATQGWLVRMVVFVVVGTVTGQLARGLREADKVFQTAFEDVPTAVVATTGTHADATIVFTNSRAVSLLGDVVGRSLEDTARALQARAPDGRSIADLLVGGLDPEQSPPDRFPSRISLVDPTNRQRHLRLRALRTTRGQTVAALEDLTEEVRITRARRHLVTLAGHHLRTPLTPVVGLASLIARHADTTGDDVLGEYADVLQRNTDRLHHVVERLTELTDLEVAPPHAYQQVALQSLLEGAARDVRDGRGRPITSRDTITVADVDHEVHVVPHHILKALTELLANAVRHGHAPIVCDAATPGDGIVEIRIRDSGPGLPPTVTPADVFLPFASVADEPGLDAPRGHGLGLALARAHCEATGAQLAYQPPNQFLIRVVAAGS